MSDIVLGALIGVGAVVVGSIITGVINHRNSKLQISARRDEVNQQLSHQEREAKIGRIINSREKVLILLREAINRSLELSNNHLVLMVQMGEASRKEDKTEYRAAIKRWEEASDESKEAKSTLEILIGQLSDSQLLRMIEEVKASQEGEKGKVVEVSVLAHQPESMNIETMKRLNRELREFHNITLSKLLPLNKRIEELLSGEPSN